VISVPVQLSVPVQPGREQARSWAVNELSRREYQAARPSLLARVLRWLVDQLSRLHFADGTSLQFGIVVVAVIVGAVVAYAIYRAGGLHRTARRAAVRVLPDGSTTAADHRAQADRCAAAQDWGGAVVERFRAIARELEERALLGPQPGRTAVEVARDGGKAVPELATDLMAAARYFDDVSYGHLSLGPSADQNLRELDTRLQAAQPLAVAQ
jgi:hypothetical protein